MHLTQKNMWNNDKMFSVSGSRSAWAEMLISIVNTFKNEKQTNKQTKSSST